jgi:hypothetical protein
MRAGKTCSARPTRTALPPRVQPRSAVAMQWSVRINEAYQRLKDPLQACSLSVRIGGASVNAESNTAMPARVS